MPSLKPAASAGVTAGGIVAEYLVSETPPSLVIPYVKDSILVNHFEFSPPGVDPYQHWADVIGRRWSATGARKTSFWFNKVVAVASVGGEAGSLSNTVAKGSRAINTATRLATAAETASKTTITLYRGVNKSNFNFAAQATGLVKPNRRWWQFWKTASSPLEHNVGLGGTVKSSYTSWTTDPRVAENFALRPGNTPGVVITAEVPFSRIVVSPNLKEVVLPWGGGVVPESEVLVKGVVRGIARFLNP